MNTDWMAIVNHAIMSRSVVKRTQAAHTDIRCGVMPTSRRQNERKMFSTPKRACVDRCTPHLHASSTPLHLAHSDVLGAPVFNLYCREQQTWQTCSWKEFSHIRVAVPLCRIQNVRTCVNIILSIVYQHVRCCLLLTIVGVQRSSASSHWGCATRRQVFTSGFRRA